MSRSIFLRGIIITADKNIKIYYKKAPVIIFGLLFPLFMFIAFLIGRKIDITIFFPGFLAMTLFFTASSVGPLITPWEKQAGTYERLLSYPVTVSTIILGDMLAGLIFGIVITTVVMTFGLIFLNISIVNVLLIPIAMLLGSCCFASLGVLLGSSSSRVPSNVMMLSSLVRFPLIFISGIFIPLQELGRTELAFSYLSPLTYLVDIFNFCLNGNSVFPAALDSLGLVFFTCVFVVAANLLHKRNLTRGL